MDQKKKQEWTDAYHHATYLTSGRRVETSILAVGMMFHQSLEKAFEIWIGQATLRGGKVRRQ